MTQSDARGIDAVRVAALAEERLDWRFKALPPEAWGLTVAEYLATAPTLADFGTPLLTLDAGAMAHNLRTMADWAAAAGVRLAPHGKTTMAPALWRDQLEAGAWAITLANLPQLRVARAFGVRRVLLANSLLDAAGLAWLAGELDADPEFSVSCWVDSVQGVELMDRALRAAGARRPVHVQVELGGPGGRTGARDLDAALDIARAAHAADTLRLCGLGGYEAALAKDATAAGLATVEHYLEQLAALHDLMRAEGLLDQADEVVLTAGGSAYFDQVARVLTPIARAHPDTCVVLRSGAYLVHDDGFYRSISPLVRGAEGGEPLRSAMHGWARVLSRPEDQLALLDGGKRDFPYDLGLPEPQLVRGADGPVALTGTVTALNDQHAFLRGAGDLAAVGAVVRLGLSHPCTAFDKWTLIPVLDDADGADPRVVDLVRTFF
ncbi:alanine racemase [Kitasatospora sp. MAA4]|uniref:alanine racemase n=1 Tax=Kitasatospora sp. MAA4 TaxID=3035093 RepID=UPI002475A812|nr:alanine racemase [Kitasatospora sp. MAA4]